MRAWWMVGGSVAVAVLSGCHSHFVEATITNATAARVSVVQVEYPSASFGVQVLEPGQVFHYRFKVYGSGPLKLTYFDGKQQEHHQVGPALSEGDEGVLRIEFTAQDHAEFVAGLHR